MTKSSESQLLDDLNDSYDSLDPKGRLEKLFSENNPEEILLTSSLGTTAAITLHMISKIAPEHPIYFVDTHFHFPETIHYKNQLASRLGLNIVDVSSNMNQHLFTLENESYKHNDDFCCFVNKVYPVEKLKEGKKFWISGVLRFQNENRNKLRLFEPKDDLIKFHPILDMTPEDVQMYMMINELPQNPLVYQGYGSVGCTHCTEKGDGREGRWLNTAKSECGLHQ
ncbi:MAG: phosphoadenylyl-sulfate reductase [Cyclobacteriaceae bacterium]